MQSAGLDVLLNQLATLDSILFLDTADTTQYYP